MKLRHMVMALTLALVLLLTVACACEHDWQEASCTTPRLCTLCGEIEGAPAGHKWSEATCSEQSKCTVCGITTGATLPHTWQEATCTSAKTCTVCGATEGAPNPHVMQAATCKAPATCSVCGASDGEPLAHSYESKVETIASCRYDGRIRYTCTECRHSYEETYAATKYSAEDLYRVVADSVCEITVKNKKGEQIGLGTGFVYRANGLIVTNYHVIAHAYSATVTLGDKTYVVQRLAGYDKEKDIAVLKIVADGLKPLSVCGLSVPTGTQVYALGSSLGLTATFTRGIITQGERDIDGVRYLQHDAAISPGNSGGPLLNEYGEVIGINARYIDGGQNLNFSVFAGELQTMKTDGNLSLIEFYQKENDPITQLIQYAQTYGTDVGVNGNKEALIDVSVDYDTMMAYGCSITHVAGQETLIPVVAISSADMAGTVKMFYLYITRDSQTYAWLYIDATDPVNTDFVGVMGEVDARSFTPEVTALESDDSTASYYETIRYEEEAATALHYLLENLDALMASEFGGSIDMLGFSRYN